MAYSTPSFPGSPWDGSTEKYKGPEQDSAGSVELTSRIIAEIRATQANGAIGNSVLDAFEAPMPENQSVTSNDDGSALNWQLVTPETPPVPMTGSLDGASIRDALQDIHLKNAGANVSQLMYKHGAATVDSAYIGAVYNPIDNRTYLVPFGQANQSVWHYIDHKTQIVGAYANSMSCVSNAYHSGVYSPKQKRIYLIPVEQITQSTWHYIDAITGEVVAYSPGITLPVWTFYGGVYSPTQDRIYLPPHSYSSSFPNLYYIDCSNGNLVADSGFDRPSASYAGGVYSPTQNRIYFVPHGISTEDNWHYIDCSDGSVVEYANNDIYCKSFAYVGGVYSPTQDRIYLVPYGQASYVHWHYIDCSDGSIVKYEHGTSSVNYAYLGGCYSPATNRIYLTPHYQAAEDTWHYIDCNDGSVVGYSVNGIGTNASNGYVGSVCSPLDNRIYFVPLGASDDTYWSCLVESVAPSNEVQLLSGPLFNKF